MRKLLIFKGTAIHSSSSNTLADLLNSKNSPKSGIECPKILVTNSPACEDTQFYFRMASTYLLDSGQTVLDSSPNQAHATNGADANAGADDCSP